jgi:hypothetical protein
MIARQGAQFWSARGLPPLWIGRARHTLTSAWIRAPNGKRRQAARIPKENALGKWRLMRKLIRFLNYV